MKTIQLTTGAHAALIGIMNAPGWCKTIGDIYCAGALLARLGEPKIANDRATLDKKAGKFDFSEKECVLVPQALRAVVGQTNPSRYFIELLTAFDVKE